MTIWRALLAITLAGFLLAPLPAAETYFVAENGDDSSSGTSAQPFRSVQRAVDRATPGDTIIVRPGTYGHATCLSPAEDFAVDISRSGTAQASITIRSEIQWGAVLDAESACHSYFNLGRGVAYIAIEDFVIRRGYWGGIWSNNDAHHIRIAGNRIEYIGNRPETSHLGIAGIYTGASSNDFWIERNLIHDIGRTAGKWMWHDHGIYVHGNNYVIINNCFYNSTSGWHICPAGPMDNVLIANNTFHGPAGAGRSGQIAIGEGQISNITIRNNIFYLPRRAAVVHCAVHYRGSSSVEYNLMFGVDTILGEEICGSTTGLATIAHGHNLTGDPLFVRASAPPYDFRLLPHSPAIDAALPVPAVKTDFRGNPRPFGQTPDIGSYEFSAASKGGETSLDPRSAAPTRDRSSGRAKHAPSR